MKKIKVAILDTGINSEHEYFKNIPISGYGYYYQNGIVKKIEDYNDENGHGTACASLIVKQCENIEILAIKIMDKNGKTNLKVLETALEGLLDLKVSIINLSLSIIGGENLKDLRELCKKLFVQGKIIVSSVANDYNESYPALFDNVIGVRGFILENENAIWFNKDYKIQCIIDNNPKMVCGINERYILPFKCNSHSAAKMTGIIAKIMGAFSFISYEDMLKKLSALAIRTFWSEQDLINSFRYPDCEFLCDSELQSLEEKIFVIAKKMMKIEFQSKNISEMRLLYVESGLDGDSCFFFLKNIEKELNINIDYMNVSRYDLLTIGTVVNFINYYR